ncbi:MAG: DUF2793 domain-containing protein [Pseudomonadota bacterium]
MAQPIAFSATSQNLNLPFLFSGQAQKEIYVNQAFAIIDSLVPRTVISALQSPPSDPIDGDCFLVLGLGSNDWEGQDDNFAMRISGAWCFAAPSEGMSVFDQGSNQTLVYRSGWDFASTPSVPTGGGTIDVEARTAIAELISELRKLGLFQTI